MSDDLDELKSLLYAATPGADSKKKADNIALAQKNFADLQGSRDAARLTSDRPKKGLISGVRNMLTTLTSRAGLTASTAIVAVGLVMLSPLGENLMPTTSDAAFEPAPIQEAPAVVLRKTAPEDVAGMTESAPMVAAEMAADSMATAPVSPMPMTAPAPATSRMMLDAPVMLPVPESTTESFANADTNPVQVTTQTPVSTFSIDVDTASYSVIRNSLSNGQLPPKDAVRIEEMINYFPYEYAAPTGTDAFQPTVTLTPTPWNADTQLLHIGIQGALPDLADRPPLNLVFLIDTSGSMEQPNKLPLLKQSFRLMLGQLRPEDQIAIVTYAGSAGEVLAPTAASDRATILNALENLGAGGSTAGQAGLQQAYATAAAMSEEGDVNRIILATDGDFNVGLNDPDALKDYIADKRDSGTYLSVLGFGRGNLNDATMQALAQNGNGQAAYIDTLSEAQKVLVDQLGGALFPIANDVKIQVEFNPATVSEYRLIGYETRALNREDFNNDKVDAGDIGAGHQVTAIYEVTPTGSAAERNDPLRYGAPVIAQDASDELAFLRLRYKAPGSDTSALIETPVQATVTGEAGFATAIAGFGQLLRDGTYTGDWTYVDAIKLATQTKGDDPFGYRAEAVQLMRLAQSLSAE
ncbi:vWA domain-containing protein [Sulfitobacter geojensis]|uniref:vWA domain-containing protein n=1 Tax=Sulfitobacter geojensis TaxID=1342299 RepID=UPI0036DBCD8D